MKDSGPGILRSLTTTIVRTAPRETAEMVVVTMALGALEGAGLLLLVPLLQLVGLDDLGATQGALSGIAQVFRSAFGALGLQPTLGIVLIAYVMLVGFQGLLQQREAVLSGAIHHGVVTSLRGQLYRAMSGMQWMALARSRPSTYLEVLTTEVDRTGVAAYQLIQFFIAAVVSAVYLVLALRVSFPTTVAVLACGGLLTAVLRGTLRDARLTGERLSTAWEEFHAAVKEHFDGLKLVRSYGAQDRHAEQFERLSQRLNDVSRQWVSQQAALQRWWTLGSAACLAVMVYVSITVLAVRTAELVLLIFLFGRLLPRLSSAYGRLHGLAASLPAFRLAMDVKQRCLEAAEPVALERRDVDLVTRIDLDDVTLAYEEDKTPALRDVSLTIAAGRTTAIVGPSGAGKSTMADLLMGLIPPTRGRMLVDGQPLTPEQLEAWRARIAYVPQETFLFNDTLRANLLWARPGADEDELWEALNRAALDTFVAGLPRGLDTVVGDRGVLLSGGERQRLALARALLRKPALLILDEATSAVDAENELRIQRAIECMHEQATIVVVTHRLTTVRRADTIHVLDHGRLVESGSWNTLLALEDGRFRALCEAQGLGLHATAPDVGPAVAIGVLNAV